jgi:hypothetical protein
VIAAGTPTNGAVAGVVVASTPVRVGLAVSASAILVSVNGAEPVSMAHSLTGMTTFRLGGNVAADAQLGGECARMSMLPVSASDALLAALAAGPP